MPEKCRYVVLSTKIEIRLTKAESINWTSLEFTKDNAVPQKLNVSSGDSWFFYLHNFFFLNHIPHNLDSGCMAMHILEYGAKFIVPITSACWISLPACGFLVTIPCWDLCVPQWEEIYGFFNYSVFMLWSVTCIYLDKETSMFSLAHVPFKEEFIRLSLHLDGWYLYAGACLSRTFLLLCVMIQPVHAFLFSVSFYFSRSILKVACILVYFLHIGLSVRSSQFLIVCQLGLVHK